MMKVALAQLTQPEIDALPRTTRWRAVKRGYVNEGYSSKRIERNDEKFVSLYATLKHFAVMTVFVEQTRGTRFPAWLDTSDLVQELLVELWRKSGRPEFDSIGWRHSVMRGRLWDLRKSCTWEVRLENNTLENL